MAEASALPFNQAKLGEPLKQRDVSFIVNELASVASDWELLGTCLPGLERSEVNVIREQHGSQPKKALVAVIERWLATTDRTVTWEDILDSLRKPILKHNSLAEQIEKKISSQSIQKSLSSPSEVEQESTPKKCARSESSPAAIIQSSCDGHSQLFASQSECLLSPQLSTISMTPIQEVSSVSLPSAEPHHSKLKNVSSATNSTAIATVSNELSTHRAEYAKLSYGCGCGECTAAAFVAHRCLKPILTNSKYPYLDTRSLTEEEKDDVEIQLNEDFCDIIKKYAFVTASLRRSLKERKIPPGELVDCLMDLRGCQAITNTAQKKGAGLLKNCYKEMKKAEDISAVFEILSDDFCSFFNYDIIDFIVKSLGTEGDKHNLATYERALEKYSERHVFECPHYSDGNHKFADLVLKLNEETTKEFTLKSLRRFASKVCRVLNVTKHSLLVRSVKEGCLEVTFQIPNHIYKMIFPLSEEQEEALLSLGIQKIWHREADVPQDTWDCQSEQGTDSDQQVWKQSDQVTSMSEHRAPQATHSKDIMLPLADYHTRPRVCLRYKLLGDCRFGDKCHYTHSDYSGMPYFEPVVAYVPVPGTTSSSSLRTFLGRVDQNPQGKGFIAVDSDRASASQEVKLVAEDLSALEFAKEHVQKKFSLPPGEEVQYTRECVKYKLLGKCKYDPCQFVHGDIVESPSVGYVTHPVGQIPNIQKMVGRVGYCKNVVGSYVTLLSEQNKEKERTTSKKRMELRIPKCLFSEVKIIADSDEALYEGMKQMEIFFGQSHSVYTNVTGASLAFCYVHPKGLETRFQLKMESCEERGRRQYTVERDLEGQLGPLGELSTVKDFQYLNKELPCSIAYMLDHPAETSKMDFAHSYPAQVKLYDDYRDKIYKEVRDTLMWMHNRPVHPKLEGRFGKLRWAVIPSSLRRGPLSTKGFIHFIATNTKHKRFFRPQLDKMNVSRVVKSLRDLDSVVETYDIKMAAENKGKHDIRLKFVSGRPEIMTVRKDEEKILISDILCLNRKYDMRVSLSSYSAVPHDDPTVLKFVSSVSLQPDGILQFVPQAQDKEWTTRMVRHKVRRAYLYGKKNYLVTMTTIRSYDVKASDISAVKQSIIALVESDWREHHELEVHNLNWEVDFGRKFGMSPEQSLSLLLDPTKIPSDVLSSAPRQWTPDSVMDEFQADEFLQIMDDINKSIDHEVTVSA